MKHSSPATPERLDATLRQTLDEQMGLPASEEEALLARVKSRVLSVIGSEATPPHRTVRPADGGWERMAPGVERKVLWVSAGAQSYMVRMDPGSSITAHSHAMDEECVVLEGTLHIGPDIVLSAGDFHVGRKGSTHELATTHTGALVYLRGALESA